MGIENKKKKVMIEDLVRRKYDSDPVKAWKASLAVDDDEEEEAGDSQESLQSEGGNESKSSAKDKGPDYDYLLGMPMWNLTQEKIDKICKKRDDKQQELANLKAQTKEDLWQIDLKAFLEKLDEVEEKERMELEEGRGGDDGDFGGAASKAGKKGKSVKGKGKGMVKADTLPSKTAIRFEPKITDELKAKVEQAAAAKQRKATKKSEKADGNSQDEDDVTTEGKKGIKKEGKEGKLKQTKINFKAEKKEANPFSDDESDDMSEWGSVEPRQPSSRQGAASKKYFQEDSDNDDDAPSSAMKDEFDVSSSGSDFERKVIQKVKKPSGGAGAKDTGAKAKNTAATNKPSLVKKSQPSKKPISSGDESNSKKLKLSGKRSHMIEDSEDSDDFQVEDIAPREKPAGGRKKAAVKYDLDSTDSDF